MNRISLVGWIQYALLGLGTALLGYCAYSLVESGIFESRQMRRFEPSAPALVPSLRRIPRAHEVIGRLEAPRIRLSAIVLEGDDSRSLQLGAGHIAGTSLPGDSGNVGIAAHRDTFFRRLKDIAPGDEIFLTTTAGTYRYYVTSTEIVSPRATSVLESRGQPELTLVTCYPFHYIGPAPRRFIVHARPSG